MTTMTTRTETAIETTYTGPVSRLDSRIVTYSARLDLSSLAVEIRDAEGTLVGSGRWDDGMTAIFAPRGVVACPSGAYDAIDAALLAATHEAS